MRPLLPALAALLALALPACGTSPEEPTATPSASEATPTATPTAAPTPALTTDQWYAMTSFQIAGEQQGLDYDGDGTKDNGIYAATYAMQAAIIDGVEAWLTDQTTPCDPGPCEPPDDPSGGPANPQSILAAVTQLVEDLLSVDAVNAALGALFNNGARPYALHLYGTCPDVTLAYHQGELIAAGYVPGDLLGELDAPICGGTSALGPQTFTYDVTLDPPQGETVSLGFTVYEVLTDFNLSDPDRISAYTGGGLKTASLVDLVEQVLGTLPEVIDLSEEDIAAILSDLEASLAPLADIACDEGDACVSVTFAYDVDATTLAP